MTKEDIQKLVEQKVKELSGVQPTIVSIEKTASVGFGDYSYSGAFNLAKQQQKPPQVVAQALAEELNKVKPVAINRVEAVGGYVNFFLAPEYLRDQLGIIYKTRESFGQSKLGKGKTIIVEYSQPNIAKPMHVGHLRTTILVDAIANIYEMLGYKVIRWNYIGDWGTQFGKLIAAYKLWGDKKEVERSPIPTLVRLYVKFHEELKSHPELEQRGQVEFKKLEDGDKENLKLWQWFKKESLKEFDRMYKILGIRFDLTIGESFFEGDLKPLVADLKKRGIAEPGEGGALIVKLERFNLPPALVRKSDGASLYLTRDIAALKYRIKKYKPSEILHVVDNGQALHFQQLAAIANMLGLKPEPEHVKYGLILGENKKRLATREGRAILFEDLVNQAIELAQKIVSEKRPNSSEKEKTVIADTVALGALKYEILKEHRNTDIVFDWKRMLDFAGNSGPYLQYTYARLMSILNKAGRAGKPDLSALTEPSELAIMKHLLEFPDTVADSARMHLTNNLALYLYELANHVNRFYEIVPILKDDNHARLNARLVLINATASVLKSGLGLLGINVLEKI